MDPSIRGSLEQDLDSQLTDEILRSNFNLFKSFKNENLIDAIESAMVSQIWTNLAIKFLVFHIGKDKNEKDDEELVQIFKSRAPLIKTKIREICNI